MVYPVYLCNQTFSNSMDLLLISNGFVNQILTDLCLIKQSIKVENTFVKVVYSVLVVKKVLIKHKEDCLMINGKQNVKLEKGFISFKNFNKQIPVPFKIYADFECILKGIE